jgi:3-deoxy-D-manno-octulosonic-acid transferase
MRWLYSLLLYLLTPVVFVRLWLRGRKAPAYRARWGERFGYAGPFAQIPRIWIHAVSVGETIAAAPLVRALKDAYPDHAILITSTTPTGSAQVQRLFGEEVEHCYLPYDLPHVLGRFLQRIRPRILVVMETELWPNLFAACQARAIPVLVVNARLSERSFRGYRKILPLIRPALGRTQVLAQTEDDAARFRSLGAPEERVVVAGNLKFDQGVPEGVLGEGRALREQLGRGRNIWIAASTHAGEDAPILQAHRYLLAKQPDALLIIVPRHPERFEEVASLVASMDFSFQRRSSADTVDQPIEVFVGDTLGEMMFFYAASDIAFVGGSLVETGGHNPLEPAALGLPVITGPHWFNFSGIYPELLTCGAARQVSDSDELAATLAEWFDNEELRREAGEAGRQVVARNRGALENILTGIKSCLTASDRG